MNDSKSDLKRHRCCFTGHRPEKLGVSETRAKALLKSAIQQAISDGYVTFISGMARGIDLWAAEIVIEEREKNSNIHLVCASPFSGFEKRWSEHEQALYRSITEQADFVKFVSQHYYKACFQVRNEWMVDRVSRVIAAYNGTFGYIIDEECENEKYDYILSNPPYVTRGSGIIKEEIKATPHTRDKYPVNALGLEGIAMEWIIRSLKKGGKAFIVIPDGILSRISGKNLREHILLNCHLDAIISLPVRTFFANNVHAYVIAITKKHDVNEKQTEPVFTYIVSDIGEKLTSVTREDIPDTDLPEMETLFKLFCGSKSNFADFISGKYPRCKVQPIELFEQSSHWVIDRWWTIDEKIALGIEETKKTVSVDDFEEELSSLKSVLDEYIKVIEKIKEQ